MIDRIEELLAELAAEEDEEEREEAPALLETAEAPPGGRLAGPADGAPGPTEEDSRSGGRTAGEIWREGPEPERERAFPDAGPDSGLSLADAGWLPAGELAEPQNGGLTAELTAVPGQNVWTDQTESAGRATDAQAGLRGLYRQAVDAARPAAPALPPERPGRTASAQEPGSAASLAVEELDRAVRRDSRRYDGGMSIF